MYDILPKMLEDIMICSTLGCVAQIRETWNPKLLSFDFSAIGFAMFCMGSEETSCSPWRRFNSNFCLRLPAFSQAVAEDKFLGAPLNTIYLLLDCPVNIVKNWFICTYTYILQSTCEGSTKWLCLLNLVDSTTEWMYFSLTTCCFKKGKWICFLKWLEIFYYL